MDEIIKFGDTDARKFYLIVSGVVQVEIPNMQNIYGWLGKWKDYQKLLEWEEKVFDPKK